MESSRRHGRRHKSRAPTLSIHATYRGGDDDNDSDGDSAMHLLGLWWVSPIPRHDPDKRDRKAMEMQKWIAEVIRE